MTITRAAITVVLALSLFAAPLAAEAEMLLLRASRPERTATPYGAAPKHRSKGGPA